MMSKELLLELQIKYVNRKCNKLIKKGFKSSVFSNCGNINKVAPENY